MARRDYAITPKGIINGLRRVAPDVAVSVFWEPDYGERWDGDAPDPSEEGMVAHSVRVSVEIQTVYGETFDGDNYLGGVWVVPGEEDPDVHGYFPQMLQEALQEMFQEMSGERPERRTSRKFWDPRAKPPPRRSPIGTTDRHAIDQVAAAIQFVTRSMHEIHERQRRRRR